MDGTTMMSPADFAAISGDGGFGNGNCAWWIIILFLFAFNGGWGGNNGTSAQDVKDGYVLASDFANISRQLDSGFANQERRTDSIVNGLSSIGYESLAQTNGINTNILANSNAIQSDIKDVQYGIATSGANIQASIKDCCCENEKSAMQSRFDMAQYNCNTLQAIDKVGDRIIDYLSNDKAQTLRDENQALRLAASQQAQNNYLISRLQPTPIPAFPAGNVYGYYGCGCGAQNI